MPSPRQVLTVVDLESRVVPSSSVSFGENWVDPQNLTISFAPDGAAIGSAASQSFETFGRRSRGPAWQTEVLRAFQMWAAQTNINIGLAKDSGEAFGTPGDIQGDARFGDIRVGARPLSPNALATAAPFDWSAGTWSGDLVFNSTAPLGSTPRAGQHDLFTVTLHEAGHSLGMPHSSDPASVMSDRYVGVRTALAASDVATAQARYGPRQPDRYEGDSGNGSLLTATELPTADSTSVTADLTEAGDVDVYAFTTASNAKKLVIRLHTSGLSLLTSRLEVLDASGTVVRSDVSVDPTNGDLEVKLDRPLPDSTYFVRVAGTTTDFGIGRYQLDIDTKNPKPAKTTFTKDNRENDSPAGADELLPKNVWGGNGKPNYYFNGVIEGKADIDFYRVTAPADVSAQTAALLVQVRALNAKGVAPQIAVFDDAMRPVAARVVTNTDGLTVLQVANVRRGAHYFVRVAGDRTDQPVGNYRVTANFTAPTDMDLLSLRTGGLTHGTPTTVGTLTLNTSGLVQFALDAHATLGVGEVTLEVRNSTGRVAYTLTGTTDGDRATGGTYLAAGAYTVRLVLKAKSGLLSGVSVSLSGGLFTDPIGPLASQVGSTAPTGPTGTSGSTSTPDFNFAYFRPLIGMGPYLF